MTNGKISFEKKTILYRLLPDDAIVVASGGHGLHFCACTNHFITVLKLLRLTLCPCDLSYLPCKELAAFAWQSIQECSPWKLFRLIRMKAHILPLWSASSSRRQPRDPPSSRCPHPSPDKPNPSQHCNRIYIQACHIPNLYHTPKANPCKLVVILKLRQACLSSWSYQTFHKSTISLQSNTSKTSLSLLG